MNLSLGKLKCNLPTWKARDFELYESNSKLLAKLARNVHQGSDRFEVACRKLLGIVLTQKRQIHFGDLTSTIEVRALCHLVLHSTAFRQAVDISPNFFQAIVGLRPSLSKLSLSLLVGVFFTHFDELDNKGGYLLLADFIRTQLLTLNDRFENSALNKNKQHADILFVNDGPKRLVDTCISTGQEFDLFAEIVGLGDQIQGRFIELARYQYYLERLRSIPVNSPDPVLAEVIKERVYNAPGKESKRLGHEVLEILIDRAAGKTDVAHWQNIVLAIAGDPRVPSSSPNFMKWWSVLGQRRIDIVRGWLSGLDLSLFLKILQTYGKSSGDDALQRMFPARKRFLEGLISQGLVTGSRLFVNPGAQEFLRNNYKKEELPTYANLRDSYRSMIYLNIDNKLHIIEGSHNAKLWIFKSLPKRQNVMNYNVSDFVPRDLGTGISAAIDRENGHKRGNYAEIVHSPLNLSWQRQAIEYLQKNKITLNLQGLFSKGDYKEYKRLYGIDLPKTGRPRSGRWR